MKLSSPTKYIVIVVALALIECALVGYIGVWREGFWQAVESRHLGDFIRLLAYFSIVALAACFVYGYGQYYMSYAALLLRRKLTKKAWKTDYINVEGYGQRIQEDCFAYPRLLLQLGIGLLKAVIILIVFCGIILYQLNWYYLLIPIAYVTIGTLIAGKIAKPLINLNYLNQVVEAKFRQYLSRRNYALAHRNNYNLFKWTKYLAFFQTFYNQITVIVPYVIVFPLYFSAKIAFGTFMQVASAMNHIIDNLSYLVNSFNDINKFLSCRKRLKELGII